MTATGRQLLLEAYLARLALIKTADGYQTNVGASPSTTLVLGESVELGQDDPEAVIAIVVGDEEPRRSDENVYSVLPVEFQALVRVSANGSFSVAYLAAEAILSDIKKAIETPDRFASLVRPRIERGVVRTVPREPGSLTVGVGITYLAPRIEAWGRP